MPTCRPPGRGHCHPPRVPCCAAVLCSCRHYKSFIWLREHGGEAYSTTLQALHKRLHNMWAELYRHHRRYQRRMRALAR